MGETFNIYCDESCHLERDSQKVMVLGALWCPRDKTREVAYRLREIKQRHHKSKGFEVKWTKVSKGGIAFYQELLDYFFDDNDLHFRGLIVPDKSKLRHDAFKQDHDTWYYKMYFHLLKTLLDPQSTYFVYIDLKDTRGAQKVRDLRDILRKSKYEFRPNIVADIQEVRSEHVEQIQLVDLLIGIVCYANKGLDTNKGKLALVERMRQRSRYNLTRSTLLRENKVNIFNWEAQEVDDVTL